MIKIKKLLPVFLCTMLLAAGFSAPTAQAEEFAIAESSELLAAGFSAPTAQAEKFAASAASEMISVSDCESDLSVCRIELETWYSNCMDKAGEDRYKQLICLVKFNIYSDWCVVQFEYCSENDRPAFAIHGDLFN